jgi:nickel/cobalt exporter
MTDSLIYFASSFWIGAVHAATPGHGKTIAAAYIVGARGKPTDAVILGLFVTLSHTSGIVLVGILASLGLPGMVPQRIEAWLALITGLLVIVIGLWTLWTQRELIMQLQGLPPMPHAPDHAQYHAEMRFRPHTHDHDHGYGHHQHGHDHAHGAAHDHSYDHDRGDHHAHGDHQKRDEEAGYHSHGWGFNHTHDLKLATTNRPGLWVLIGLGAAGGLLPDPMALALLLSALAQGQAMLGMGTVLAFSAGFGATLVAVGVIAAKVGQRILQLLSGPWAMRLQVFTSLLIIVVGVTLTFSAWRTVARLE